MSQEKVIKTLTNLGLSKVEVRVYIFLARKGPQKAKNISESLKLIKQQVYPTIKKLQSRGLVTSTLEHPARFSAVPFQKMLDLCIKAKMEETQIVQRNMDELVADWESIKIKDHKDCTPKFSVIEGRNFIYSKLEQMVLETKKQFLIISSVPNLLRADQFGLIDTAKVRLNKNVRFRFITELSENEINSIKMLSKKVSVNEPKFEGRVPELGRKLKNYIFIKDEVEAMFFIDSSDDLKNGGKDNTCLWTNSISIVQAFTSLFEELWLNSIDIREKILELETGKPTTKTIILNDKINSEKKFIDILKSAHNEIIMITTLDNFLDLRENTAALQEFRNKKVSLKIMAPITAENFHTARKLSESFDVRHIPETYLRTTLIDDSHLFQFKTPISVRAHNYERMEQFENTFYTTDSEYIEKTKLMLKDLWNNASLLSSITLESVMTPNNSNMGDREPYEVYRRTTNYIRDEIGLISETELLKKMGKRFIPSASDPLKDTTLMYGQGAIALINPPDYLNLPRMIITVLHCNDRSTFGKENWLLIQISEVTPNGELFIPVALIGDNPKSVAWRNKINKGTTLEGNLPLVNEEELQVKGHGNILFAGWTVPISLGSQCKSIPPSCLFFEGYRELGTGIVQTKPTLKRLQKTEFYGFESFVTFFHPSTKYSGPGTDGLIFRDIIITSTPM